MSENAQSKNLLLASLDRKDYALLRPHLTEIRLEQKTILQRPGAPITHAYFPFSGMISMLATFRTGEAIEIAAIGREGAVGTRLGRLPEIAFAQAIVQLPGAAMRIGIERFREAARSSAGITEIAACANEVMAINLQQSAACNALHKLEARLARWLLHSRDRNDDDRLPLSQEFLSEMLGVRRTTVTLAAHTLQNAGVISYRRGKVQITDRKGLEAIACDCYLMVKRNIEVVTTYISQDGLVPGERNDQQHVPLVVANLDRPFWPVIAQGGRPGVLDVDDVFQSLRSRGFEIGQLCSNLVLRADVVFDVEKIKRHG